MYVRYTEPVRGADAFVMQAHTEPINKWIMEQLIMVDAMKRASARSITVVAPFLGYSRQTRSIRAASPSPHASCSTCSVPPAPTAS